MAEQEDRTEQIERAGEWPAITDEVVALAWQAIPEDAYVDNLSKDHVRLMLEVAAPVIASQAWDDGFTACAHEHMAQDKDPTHPITRTNPHSGVFYMWDGQPISREDLQSRLDEMHAAGREVDEHHRRATSGG